MNKKSMWSGWRWSWHHRPGWFWGHFDAGPNVSGWNLGPITIWRYRIVREESSDE